MSDQFKRCPFCGSEMESWGVNYRHPVHDTCFVSNVRLSPDEFESWNTRPLEGEWQAIDNAPRDGTPLLLFARYVHATASVIVAGHYLPDSFTWINTSFGNAGIQQIVPSHWQRLPAFPVATNQRGGD